MVTVTEIRREGSRVHIEAESHRVTITTAMYRLRPLEQGEAIDWEEYHQWLVKQQYPVALQAAARMLAMRAHSRGEIRQKLLRATCLPYTVELVLLKLEQMKLVDDAAFAREWASVRANHMGTRRIADELRRKEIPQELIHQALEEVPEEQLLDSAEALARSGILHRKKGEDMRVTRQKVIQRLARRGYSWDIAKEAFSTALQTLREEGFETDEDEDEIDAY